MSDFDPSKIKVITEFNKDVIQQFVQGPYPIDLYGKVSKDIMKLKEEGVRKALKQLGWTSPEESEQLQAQLNKVKEALESVDLIWKHGFNSIDFNDRDFCADLIIARNLAEDISPADEVL